MVVVQLTVDNYFRKKIVFLFDSRSGKVFPINGGSQALWIIKIRKNDNVIIEKTDKQRKKQKKKSKYRVQIRRKSCSEMESKAWGIAAWKPITTNPEAVKRWFLDKATYFIFPDTRKSSLPSYKYCYVLPAQRLFFSRRTLTHSKQNHGSPAEIKKRKIFLNPTKSIFLYDSSCH